MAKKTPPTEKQIAYAQKISEGLGIEFPICAAEYTKSAYSAFIKAHQSEYHQLIAYLDEDTIMEFCYNDVWCEYY